MGFGRIVGTLAAVGTVAGCALVVVGMTRADADKQANDTTTRTAWHYRPDAARLSAVATFAAPAAAHRVAAAHTSSAAPSVHPTATPTHSVTHSATHSATHTVAPPPTKPSTHTAAPKPKVTQAAPAKPKVHPTPARPARTHTAAKRGHKLPLHFGTGRATRVITVVAHSHHRTTARLQAWNKAPGGGWLRTGRSVIAHVGSDGLSKSASEYKSATPIGSFTLTQAFGRLNNPGTKLHYFKTTPADWWISQPGRLYNTHQRCSSNCAFTQGSPNEHLYYETPYYNHAVVINYNRHPVRQGAGSAFFLHVTDGQPTAGCVAIPSAKLSRLMRSLRPSQHPRIVIGVA
jgi:L,D-peptidoglycan transpeptidase YkuD (ErfK/YbiS/YcfS/YnhG family)